MAIALIVSIAISAGLSSAVLGRVVGQQSLSAELLPDLEMAPIYGIQLAASRDGTKMLLRFGTIIYNIGDGPLEVRAGRRRGIVMHRVVQVIARADGSTEKVVQPGEIAYLDTGRGHHHFHLANFVVMRLTPLSHRAGSPTPRNVRKIGFCLADSVRLSATPGPPYYAWSGCGDAAARHVKMGISVGWGDDYQPGIAHQDIDVTGLPAGKYRLCATVNPAGQWREKADNVSNNAYWVDVRLDVVSGRLTILQTGTSSC